MATTKDEATEGKTARQKFVDSAGIRVNAALDCLTKVAKLNSPRYEYTEEDVEKIMDALEAKCARVRAVLMGEGQIAEGFTLDEA